MIKTVKEKEQKAFEVMKAKFHYKNKMAAPKMVKIVVAVGTGSGIKKNKDWNKHVMDRLAKITGQKPATRASRKSVSGFKIRIGDEIGVMVTLRGARMYGFLDKLVNIAIPRTKDFRGVDRKVVDNIGNMTMSIKEHTIFPETGDEELKDVFGMAVTLVTSAKTRDEAIEFFSLLGMPFKK